MPDNNEGWSKVTDILDVWFDSGSTHAFCLKRRDDLKDRADLYLEGSDQHRGWFQSSLLESCAVYGEAPYDGVLTHGFVVDEPMLMRVLRIAVGDLRDFRPNCQPFCFPIGELLYFSY